MVSFAPQTTFPTGTGPSVAVAGDFNGDGKLDLATANLEQKRLGVAGEW